MKKSVKKVSVIIPTYNEENNIVRLLKSINSQTYKNVESIVVDDGSTDKTVKYAKKYATKVYKRKHAERSVQRNFGAKKAKGNYVVFLDADMELTPNVIQSCATAANNRKVKAVVIPEKTMGTSFMSRIRIFEREMYEGDETIEVARFFDNKVFKEMGGYDENLTGAEDYDLPYRVGKKYRIVRAEEYLLHHEQQLTLLKQLKKKYYYASKSTRYAQKHPELVVKQGNMLFRKAYLRNWKKFVSHPILGISFILVRTLETLAAVLGYIRSVGVMEFASTFINMFKK